MDKDQKAGLITAIGKLSQQQVDELIRILKEERQKFSDVARDPSQKAQLRPLEAKAASAWATLEAEMGGTGPEGEPEEEGS